MAVKRSLWFMAAGWVWGAWVIWVVCSLVLVVAIVYFLLISSGRLGGVSDVVLSARERLCFVADLAALAAGETEAGVVRAGAGGSGYWSSANAASVHVRASFT